MSTHALPTIEGVPAPGRLGRRSDEALRAMSARGDAAAFSVVYQRHERALYRYCWSILRHDEDARDALHNTMVKAWEALRRSDRDVPLRPWLFRIAHNEAVNLLRERRAHRELCDTHAVADCVEDDVELRQRVDRLRADISVLPDRQRSALLLRELCGLSHDEIAAVLVVSAATARQTIYEARIALHEAEAGRAMACAAIQRALSDGDGRVRRGRRIRSHIRSCEGCSSFEHGLRRRPGELAALLPPLPGAASVGLVSRILSLEGTSGGVGSAGTAAGSASLATSTAAEVATCAVAKIASGAAAKIVVGSVIAATAVTAASGPVPVARLLGSAMPGSSRSTAPADGGSARAGRAPATAFQPPAADGSASSPPAHGVTSATGSGAPRSSVAAGQGAADAQATGAVVGRHPGSDTTRAGRPAGSETSAATTDDVRAQVTPEKSSAPAGSTPAAGRRGTSSRPADPPPAGDRPARPVSGSGAATAPKAAPAGRPTPAASKRDMPPAAATRLAPGAPSDGPRSAAVTRPARGGPSAHGAAPGGSKGEPAAERTAAKPEPGGAKGKAGPPERVAANPGPGGAKGKAGPPDRVAAKPEPGGAKGKAGPPERVAAKPEPGGAKATGGPSAKPAPARPEPGRPNAAAKPEAGGHTGRPAERATAKTTTGGSNGGTPTQRVAARPEPGADKAREPAPSGDNPPRSVGPTEPAKAQGRGAAGSSKGPGG